ncbi:uncharacterized protein LAJ45_07402 [Morchella importuna]|uniref:uncharacterized protein n=1 Tax=Morchella importuna TaxID=1174673 RepID=UPI001E8DC78E|nr:uncharacterized protein LAJ45_07402 [Morchella importuna]KAH8148691.1 hypothetical protein LAJ45_07402 [Morchella importuna]
MSTTTRSHLLRSANNHYLCGRVPLVHAIIMLAEIVGLAQLAFQFDLHFAAKPILTMMVTNAILGGVADTVAQIVSSVQAKSLRKPLDSSKKDGISIEIHDLNEKGPLPSHRGDLVGTQLGFDFERWIRFMAWGLIMAPVSFSWFEFLSEIFPITPENRNGPALLRVLLDQVVFSPISLAIFFIYMTLAEGGGKKAIARKFSVAYAPVLKVNYIIWPAVQILNFRLVPLALQLPFASTVVEPCLKGVYFGIKEDLVHLVTSYFGFWQMTNINSALHYIPYLGLGLKEVRTLRL